MPSMAATAVVVLAAVLLLFAVSARKIMLDTVLIVLIGYAMVLIYRHFSKYSDFRFGSDNRQALIEGSIIVIASIVGLLYFINQIGV